MMRNSRLIDEAPSAAIAQYNRELEGVFLDAENALHNQINSRFDDGDGSTSRKFKYFPRISFGEVVGARFRMPRHAILRQHGVGRGQPKGTGNSWSQEEWWNEYWDGTGLRRLAEVAARAQGDVYSKAFTDKILQGIKLNR